jgi:hypothetical protein
MRAQKSVRRLKQFFARAQGCTKFRKAPSEFVS